MHKKLKMCRKAPPAMSAHTCAPADYVQRNLSAATCSGRQVLALLWCTRRPGRSRRRPPPSTARSPPRCTPRARPTARCPAPEEPLQSRRPRTHFTVNATQMPSSQEEEPGVWCRCLEDGGLSDVDPPERPAGLLLPHRQELDIVLAGGLTYSIRPAAPGSAAARTV